VRYFSRSSHSSHPQRLPRSRPSTAFPRLPRLLPPRRQRRRTGMAGLDRQELERQQIKPARGPLLPAARLRVVKLSTHNYCGDSIAAQSGHRVLVHECRRCGNGLDTGVIYCYRGCSADCTDDYCGQFERSLIVLEYLRSPGW
jgi:hypothetical protein